MNAIVEHTYTVAGTSFFDGVVTYRFANDVKRMKVLERTLSFPEKKLLREMIRATVLGEEAAE